MPKKRAAGAARPYTYWATQSWVDEDGLTHTRRVQRWKQQVYVGFYPNGKPKRKTFTAGKSAQVTEKIRAWRKELKENDGVEIDRRATLGSYAAMFLEQKKNTVDPRTYRMYTSIITNHLNEVEGRALAEFTPSMIRRILAGVKAHDRKGRVTGPAGTSLKRQVRTTLHSLFESARQDRIIPTNPAEKVAIPQSKDAMLILKTRERTAFTVHEMESMLRAAAALQDQALGARMWFRLLTGMRQGEILGATQRDLILHRAITTVIEEHEVEKTLTITDAQGQEHEGTTTVREAVPVETTTLTGTYSVNWKLEELQKDHGCGDPGKNGIWPCGKKRGADCPNAQWRTPDSFDMIHLTGRWCLTHPKSKTGRTVPIIPILAQVLQRHQKHTRKQPNPHALLFHNPDGTPIDPKQDTNDFQQLMALAKIHEPDRHSGHETRHSVVSLLASMGVDAQLIKEIVGHSSDAMVEHYRHADEAERLKAMETLDESLNLTQIEWQ